MSVQVRARERERDKRAEGLYSMRPLDLAGNTRIPMLMELVTAMHQFAEPHELMEKFITTLRRAYGARCYVQLTTGGLMPGSYRVNRLLTQDGRDLVETEPELPVGKDLGQPLEVGVVVAAVPRLGAAAGSEKADPVVVVQRPHGHPGHPGDLAHRVVHDRLHASSMRPHPT